MAVESRLPLNSAGGFQFLVDLTEQCCGNFSVRLGEEAVAVRHECGLERGIVFNDAVVDHGKLAAGHHVRVRVGVRGPAMGGPPGVTNPRHGSRERVHLKFVQELGKLAAFLAHFDAVCRDQGHSGGVVAPVFQASQPLHQDFQSTVSG